VEQKHNLVEELQQGDVGLSDFLLTSAPLLPNMQAKNGLCSTETLCESPAKLQFTCFLPGK